MAEHNILGKQGEAAAVDLLVQKGYTILERNYRFHRAEVDIIAQKKQTIIAVEVKTRSSSHFGDPHEFVKAQQVQRLVAALDHYIQKKAIDVEARFDFIGIIKNKKGTQIDHIENAFLYY